MIASAFRLCAVTCLLSAAACGSPAQPTAANPPESAASATVPVTEVSTPVPSPSAEPEPTVPPPPVIEAVSFSQRTVLHEYWAEIAAAGGLLESNRLARSLTAWAYSPDGRYLAVAGCDAEVGDESMGFLYYDCENTVYDSLSHAYLLILDTETEAIIATLPESGEVITGTQMEFSNDGDTLIYALSSGRVVIWDVAAGEVKSVLAEEWPTRLSFGISPDGKWIALAAEHSTRIWDTESEEFVAELPNGAGYTGIGILKASSAPRFSPDGQRLLLTDFPVLAIYVTDTWEELSVQMRKPIGIQNAYAISPDLSTLAVCDTRNADVPNPMGIWNLANGERTLSLRENLEWNRCNNLTFTPAGDLLMRFDSSGGGPLLWDTDDWQFHTDTFNQVYFVGAGDGYVKSLQFSQDGQTVMVETGKRLTLYGLPAPTRAFADLPPVSDPASPVGAPLRTQSCELKVTGALQLEQRPCDPPSRGFGGGDLGLYLFDSATRMGVIFSMPGSLAEELTAKTYNIGSGEDGPADFQIVAYFYYPDENTADDPYFDPVFYSYHGGTLTFTQAGPKEDYVSGSFYFGAHRLDTGRQINVEGTFENIPFGHLGEQ